MKTVTVQNILSYNDESNNIFQLSFISENANLTAKISKIDINRPGLALAGFFEKFSHERVQIFGRGESAFLESLSITKQADILNQFFQYKFNLCFFSHGIMPSEIFLKYADKKKVAVLVSNLTTAQSISSLTQFLEYELAPSVRLHGVLVDVFGEGVLLIGKSGVGKSEVALELIKRGHRFVADDVVDIKKTGHSVLTGQSDAVIMHKIEVRGLGIIDVKRIFGVGSVRASKRIDMVIQMDEWHHGSDYDRLGKDCVYYDILDVKIPMLELPVKAGRNVAVIIETSVMNKRLKDTGYNSLDEIEKDMRYKKVAQK